MYTLADKLDVFNRFLKVYSIYKSIHFFLFMLAEGYTVQGLILLLIRITFYSRVGICVLFYE